MSDAENPFNTQVGGGHYTKLKIQPFQYSLANGLGPAEHTVVKYVSRWRDKGGLKDLEKAKHVIDLLIAFEKGELFPAEFFAQLGGPASS